MQKGTVPLAKASGNEHKEENLGAFEFQVADGDTRRLDDLNQHDSSLGPAPQDLRRGAAATSSATNET